MKILPLALLLGPALLAGCAVPGYGAQVTPQRPTFSSDTSTTAHATLELESGLLVDPNDSFDSPLTLKYGLGEARDVFVGVSPLVQVEGADGDESGLGDVSLGTRQKLRDEDRESPSLAWLASVRLPTGDETKGLGSGETDVFLAAIASKNIEDVAVTGYYQLGFLGETDQGGLDLQHGLALAGSQALPNSFVAFGEVALTLIPEQSDEQLFTTLGIGYAFSPAVFFDVGAVIGLTDGVPDLALLIGVTQNYGQVGRPRGRPATQQ